MHIIHRLGRLPFVRNLGGALMGAVVALVLYGTYGASLKVMASLLPEPHTDTTERSLQAARDAKVLETALRAKAIADGVH